MRIDRVFMRWPRWETGGDPLLVIPLPCSHRRSREMWAVCAEASWWHMYEVCRGMSTS